MKAVILAAGESSRFWPINSQNKCLFKIMGRPLIWYTIEGLKKVGIKEIIIIQGPKRGVEKEISNYKFPALKIKYVIQETPKGMGNALWQAKNFLKGKFLVLNAERVDIDEIIKNNKFSRGLVSGEEIVLFGQKTNNPELFGMLRLKGDKVLEIVEKPKKGKEPSDIKAKGVYILNTGFFEIYKKVKKHQYDFEDALSSYMKKNDVRVIMLNKSEKDTLCLKYPWRLFDIERYLMNRFLKSKIDASAGSASVQIAKNVIIQGKVYIGKNTKIFENAVIKGPCYIGAHCIVGNNAFLREYVNVENNCLLGTNLEITRTILQENVHFHSGYCGDSIFESGCRAGADIMTSNIRLDRGTINSKVKGKKIDTYLKRLGAIVGKNTFFGTRVNIMPGILIGSNCRIGPNSLVRQNIKNSTIFYTKFERVMKKNEKN
jgi:bifunctional UDP-N-acetylglucosamine pyrophosphorylase/glucosamine-1-phosphate N-acetyltransferase